MDRTKEPAGLTLLGDLRGDMAILLPARPCALVLRGSEMVMDLGGVTGLLWDNTRPGGHNTKDDTRA